jgi:hypothetical protein
MKNLFFDSSYRNRHADAAGAAAAELPTFEVMGISDLSPHQVQVVGATYVQERSPTSTVHAGRYARLASSGSSLTPRVRITEAAANLTRVGFSFP